MSKSERKARGRIPHAVISCGVAQVAFACAAAAQGTTVLMGGRLADWSDATVGSEEENYLRVLQVAGVARQRPWSIRPFGPGELRDVLPDSAAHPWRSRARFGNAAATLAFRTVGADAGVAYNSAVPFSMNDGAIWTGRGTTVYARGGVVARWRWLSARLEPTAFVAQNRRFPLAENGQTGPTRFGDALEWYVIDAPQRFGDHAYARIDLGQSTVRVDGLGVALGVTTANQWFGPAVVDPTVLGDNAAGYPRAFVGTARPANIGIGTVHAIAQTGRLGQSAYSSMPADSAFRTGIGFAAVVTIRGIPGLELGASRFFHEPWEGASHALQRLSVPFHGLYGFSGGTTDVQNQLSSAFGRWVLAPAHMELYAEFMRNDANRDTRDLLGEPDHNSGYVVGGRRVWYRGTNRLSAFRFEVLNTRITQLNRIRGQTRPYQHAELRQGHTELGQILGSEAGQGGSAMTVGFDSYRADGRWTVEFARRTVQSSVTEAAPFNRWDVRYLLRAERLHFGQSADLFVGAAPVVELNRDVGKDSYGVRLDAGLRFGRRPPSR